MYVFACIVYVCVCVCVLHVESNLLTMLLKTELKRRDAALFVNVVGGLSIRRVADVARIMRTSHYLGYFYKLSDMHKHKHKFLQERRQVECNYSNKPSR